MSTVATKQRRIPVCEPLLDGREREYVLQCLDGNWVSSMGEFLPRFERRFAELCGVRHAVACSNGTTAIHLALTALHIGPGDEVIIPTFTLIASANMVALCGAKPVLVDVRPDTWCIDESQIAGKITPRTRAIMVVHMYGHPCAMDAIASLAAKHRLTLMEDAAQAHGAKYMGRMTGGLGDVACFSFYANKIITTGEGGMITTNDAAVADRARLLRNQAFTERRFVHEEMGFNYRMTNIQAGIGLAQCERWDDKIQRKRAVAMRYDALLNGEPDLQTPVESPGCQNVYWMYGVVLGDAYPSRDSVRSRLEAEGVETRAFFTPMHEQPVFQGRDPNRPDLRGSFPVSEWLGRRGLYLPSGPTLTKNDQEYVVERLLSCRR